MFHLIYLDTYIEVIEMGTAEEFLSIFMISLRYLANNCKESLDQVHQYNLEH